MESLLYHLIRTRCAPSILAVLTTHYTGAAGGEEDEGRQPSSPGAVQEGEPGSAGLVGARSLPG